MIHHCYPLHWRTRICVTSGYTVRARNVDIGFCWAGTFQKAFVFLFSNASLLVRGGTQTHATVPVSNGGGRTSSCKDEWAIPTNCIRALQKCRHQQVFSLVLRFVCLSNQSQTIRGPSRLLMMEQGELYWMLDVFIVAQVNKQKGPLWGPGIMSAASVVQEPMPVETY